MKAPRDEVHALPSVEPDSSDSSTWTQILLRRAPDGAAWMPVEGAPQDPPPPCVLVGADDEGLIPLDRSATTPIWYPLATESSD